MPRLLSPEISFDDLDDEAHYTIAAVNAEPDAVDLAPMTTDWLDRIEAARRGDREVRAAVARTDACRKVANLRLDRSCTSFGRQLEVELERRLDQPRWRRFFDVPVSLFVRRGLSDQVARVRAWFGLTDPVLEVHRPELERWATASERALADTRALSSRRGENWQRREELAADLTRERDALHDALSTRGRERGYERGWPDVFFKVERRSRSVVEDDRSDEA